MSKDQGCFALPKPESMQGFVAYAKGNVEQIAQECSPYPQLPPVIVIEPTKGALMIKLVDAGIKPEEVDIIRYSEWHALMLEKGWE